MPVDKSNWVVGKVLAAHAASRGDAPFLQFRDQSPLTYGEVNTLTDRLANGLLGHDIAQGEHVGVMVPNSIDYCLVWFALSRLGAVHVSINIDYKGIFLSHVLNNGGGKLLILHADYLARLAEVEEEVPALEQVIVLGDAPPESWPAFKRLRPVPYAPLLAFPDTPIDREVSYKDIGAIQYTSGTTGPSKGVLMPHAHLYVLGLGETKYLKMTGDDVFYICMPLFHSNAMLLQLYGSLIVGCHVIITGRFSASGWLDDIRQFGVTMTNTLGVMTEFIFRQPERAEDSDHRLRAICAIPAPIELREPFEKRFGTRLIEAYGMTEINMVVYNSLDGEYRSGSCGKPFDTFFDVRVVDPETDEPVPTGEMGEIVARPKEPFCFMQGYNAMDEKTVEAWRNFWFHTGDAGRMDEDGYFYFVDRIKDCIRVRGENISSYEIEKVLSEHPAVAEAAAVAVKSEIAGGEDEIKACLVLKDLVIKEGIAPTPEDVLDFCQTRMPYFAVPRFVEFLEALPKTPTEKVRKTALRDQGVTEATWDRNAAGYQVRRHA